LNRVASASSFARDRCIKPYIEAGVAGLHPKRYTKMGLTVMESFT